MPILSSNPYYHTLLRSPAALGCKIFRKLSFSCSKPLARVESMGSKLSFLRFPSRSQTSSPPEDQVRLITHEVEEEEEENQKEIHSQTKSEEVVNDSPSVSDDQTMRRTPCLRKPTPMKKTTTMDVVLPQPAGKPTSAKRRLSPEFEQEAAKKKKKKKSGNRFWSEEDEVLILKGLMDFRKKKGAEPCPDMGEFHELIMESLSVNASKNQLLDKIRKLRRKYTDNVAKGGKAGLLSKTHEHECFELSNRIWIDDGGGGALSTRATRKNARQLDEEKEKEVALGEKAEELEKKWRIWRADEVALRLRQDELIEEQKKLMLDVVRASKE